MNQPLGQLIAVGRTAEVYALGEDRVIKLFYDWCPPNWVQQEIKIASLISSTPIPTPKLIERLEIEGRQGIIYKRVHGPSLLKLMMTKPWMAIQFARLLAEIHTDIHKNSGDQFPSQRAVLSDTIQHVGSLTPELKTNVLTLLDGLPDDNILCHCDFHPDQVLITDHGPVVLDWMTARQGNPLSDVARTYIMLMFGQVPYGNWLMRMGVKLWREIFYRTYIKRYLELHPDVTREEIFNWMIPMAAARLNEAMPDETEPILRYIHSHFNQ